MKINIEKKPVIVDITGFFVAETERLELSRRFHDLTV